jgi:protein-S-isoprenylcysteine O-methyltransferase Ste14
MTLKQLKGLLVVNTFDCLKKSHLLVLIQFTLLGAWLPGGSVFEDSLLPGAVQGLGLFIILWGILSFRLMNLRVFPEPAMSVKLNTHGIYGIIRHPMYTGIMLYTWAGSFQQPSFRPLISLGLTVLFMLKSRHEEFLLTNKFPEYAEYKRKTGRFIPFFKPFISREAKNANSQLKENEKK